jgi:hypothetical protein
VIENLPESVALTNTEVSDRGYTKRRLLAKTGLKALPEAAPPLHYMN